jgi:hypothetical protein
VDRSGHGAADEAADSVGHEDGDAAEAELAQAGAQQRAPVSLPTIVPPTTSATAVMSIATASSGAPSR